MNHHILEVLAGLLEPNEREAVLGDLAESNKSWARSLRDLLGLVGRRQGQAWMQANSWIVLLLLVLPIGSFLTQSSRSIADSSALHLWMLASNWSAARQGDPVDASLELVRRPPGRSGLLGRRCCQRPQSDVFVAGARLLDLDAGLRHQLVRATRCSSERRYLRALSSLDHVRSRAALRRGSTNTAPLWRMVRRRRIPDHPL